MNLAQAIGQLSRRPASFQQVVEHLEGDYISAQTSNVQKGTIIEEAKLFVVDGVVNMMADIETAALHMEQAVDSSSANMNNIANEIDIVQNRLNAAKDHYLVFSLEEMKRSKEQEELSIMAVEEDEESFESTKKKKYLSLLKEKKAQTSLEQRLQDIKNVGITCDSLVPAYDIPNECPPRF